MYCRENTYISVLNVIFLFSFYITIKDANHDESYTFMNGSLKLPKKNHETEHNKNNLIEEKTVKVVNKSTSTSDITNNTQTKSTSTEDLEKELFSHKDHKEEIKSRQVKSYKRNELTSQRRKALLKASSSPNIFEGKTSDLLRCLSHVWGNLLY